MVCRKDKKMRTRRVNCSYSIYSERSSRVKDHLIDLDTETPAEKKSVREHLSHQYQMNSHWLVRGALAKA